MTQPSLFNRARYRNPNRCQLRPHSGRKVTHMVRMLTSNPRNPERSFGVCGECARKWERVEGAKVTPLPTNDAQETDR